MSFQMENIVRTFHTNRYNRFVVAASVAGLAAGTIAVAARTDNGTIKACVHEHNGQVRIARGTVSCPHASYLLEWNREGLAGPPGRTGPEGPRVGP